MKQYDNLVEWNDSLHFSSTKPTLHIVSNYFTSLLCSARINYELIHK